ncbi:5,10-methylene tetrahydromethanopterin reductase [Tumebacillus algifaecis]|uniref:5,10-methylene tetrahydromethanopterin reductase n=1 Tax=Tumebacillus algifaecis TaxID=1214604 RepID=A0A223CWM3_9BACL|nr:LLM class flavin-dependent oxidoreductase [Tumebacillus algifaecis]ASS73594.1 5,10-methylene tetrahydromethanopterin reductase [Tumebacillus algifaecis]
MGFKLSVLDLCPLGSGFTATQALENTLDLARLADQLGYERYWLAEHHNMPGIASTAPEIMIGQVARVTERIRVGSGGIMLPNHTPLKVVETFKMLEALFPGRIDLGLGRAPGTDPWTAQALRKSKTDIGQNFPEQLIELLSFASGEFPDDHPYRNIKAVPVETALPPVWLLGSSDFSAILAAKVGLHFAFAHHINDADAVPAMRSYRTDFQPSRWQQEPHALITVSAICAETEEEANYHAKSLDLTFLRLIHGTPGLLPTPEEAMAYEYTADDRLLTGSFRHRLFVGTPEQVGQGIVQLMEQTGADEVMINSMIHSHTARKRSYELLAKTLL